MSENEDKKFYRYEVNPPYSLGAVACNAPPIECDEYIGIKKTACGWWIQFAPYVGQSWAKKHWVSDTARKRFAYPTKRQAFESLVARKRRREEHLRRELDRAEMDNRVISEWIQNNPEDCPSMQPIKDFPTAQRSATQWPESQE